MNNPRGKGRGRAVSPRLGSNQTPNAIENTLNTKSADEKFQDAQEKFQASVKKHLKNDYESSSDEENLESESILNSVLKNYSTSNEIHGLERTIQFLENSFQSGAAVCLICIATIKRVDPIWNCLKCYGSFHINCVYKWAKDSIFHQKQAQEGLPEFRKVRKFGWACPKCRHDYEQLHIPQKYLCFCSKVENPAYEPWLVPHSCGEICGKLLQPECAHQCLLLCHPGPCPPCPKMIKSSCYCKKSDPKQQRCCNKFWSCNSMCGKSLGCKKHTCEDQCHPGVCAPCERESIQKCNCGLKQRKQPCTSPNWQCEKVCGKSFSCGFHQCSVICHEGPCGECPRSLERKCPCGKSVSLLPCTEEVPTCNDTCGKLLECRSHRCSQKCHKEKCGKCFEIVTKVCRCGLHKKDLPCQKEFFCETKCKVMKDCMRHLCNRKCCDLLCPPCEKPCGRTLGCGKHKCPSVCHRGRCNPCLEIIVVKCRCGSTSISYPCNKLIKGRSPKCTKLCLIPPDCHHPSRISHRCHFGVCPPCREICNKDRSSCTHKCRARCHSAVWIEVEDTHRPAGPWEVVEPQMIRRDLPCPECKVQVPVTCLGGHETSNWPCFKARPSSCQRPCGRLLKCGNHACSMICHEVIGSTDPSKAGENCAKCESECVKKRPDGCTHRCNKPCHSEPCPPCTHNLKVKCHCSISTLYIRCAELSDASEDVKKDLLSCGNECPNKLPCGHKCHATCHLGECPNADSCRKKVKLSCKCGRLKKDFTCDVIRASEKKLIECDELCFIKIREEEEVKELKVLKEREEEERRNREEVEKFEKKFYGKKKQRQRNRSMSEKNESWFSKYIFIYMAGTAALAGVFFLFQVANSDPSSKS